MQGRRSFNDTASRSAGQASLIALNLSRIQFKLYNYAYDEIKGWLKNSQTLDVCSLASQ